ncbi:hypothetical protein ACH5RR_006766 [Cinchona calisaya]|uniref:RNase H type-1 domain-containing protein n=1 Tax=Cinchona calisaya TaxID=153742 RepID=A0ABD3AQ07_9GENT
MAGVHPKYFVDVVSATFLSPPIERPMLYRGDFSLQPAPVPVAWRWPTCELFKLNVDGFSIGGGNSGSGDSIRDSSRVPIHAFNNYYGITSNVVAELLALRDGLNHRLSNGF